ncbi:MAG: mechanosensitive ion channel [Planctomycetota bacterium]|nr:mechanosensitive ion channel [Planctomycetota bacterium]
MIAFIDIDWQAKLNDLVDGIVYWAPNLLWAIGIYVIGKLAAKIARSILRGMMRKGKADETLTVFVTNIAYGALMAFVVIAALGRLGVETNSLVAILATAGLAIGLALQGSLGNFAAGVMLIMFRPFKLGDFVEAGGVTGKVKDIQIFSTVIDTPDNKRMIIPNGSITSDVITNYDGNPTRRVDLVAGIGYGDDAAEAKRILEDILEKEPLVLKDPAPAVAMVELADSSVNFNVRPWCKSGDYWTVYSSVTEQIKLRFDAAGISIPYPQQDVHMHTVA